MSCFSINLGKKRRAEDSGWREVWGQGGGILLFCFKIFEAQACLDDEEANDT